MDFCIEERVFKCVAQELFNTLKWGHFDEDRVGDWAKRAREILEQLLYGTIVRFENEFGAHNDVNLTSQHVTGVRVFAIVRNDVIYTGFAMYAPIVQWKEAEKNMYSVMAATWREFRQLLGLNEFTPMRPLFATKAESIGPKLDRFEKNVYNWAAGVLQPEDWHMSNWARWVESVSDEYVAYWETRLRDEAERREEANGRSPYLYWFH